MHYKLPLFTNSLTFSGIFDPDAIALRFINSADNPDMLMT